MTEEFIIFTDLDGTLIRSAKNRAEADVVVERKNGEEITCVSPNAAKRFSALKNAVPITTRSIEQYQRIDIPGFSPEYAVCANGGILLVNGEVCEEWLRFSKSAFDECKSEMDKCREMFENDENRSFELRLVDGLFLFTKSRCAAKTIANAGGFKKLNCFSVGEKVYAFPKALEKGTAAKRFIERQNFRGKIICAGDSLPDISMLNTADIAIFPEDLKGVCAKTALTVPREAFCDFVAEKLAEICG